MDRIKRIRHLQRFREIAGACVKHGFGYFIEEIGLFNMLSFPKKVLSKQYSAKELESAAVRLRLLMEELGPTFIKFGQILSTHPEMLPQHFIEEFKKLQDDVQSFSYEQIKETMEVEFGVSVEELFASFQKEPLAAASIGQVHLATLPTGEEVAVKVQRPDIKQKVDTDIDILHELIRLAEKRFDWAKRYQLQDMLDEFDRSIHEELNYLIEARYTDKMFHLMSNDEHVKIPKIYWDYTTKKVLTMEKVSGAKLKEVMENKDHLYDRKVLSDVLVNSFLKNVLYDGFFHGDPHPGNLFFLPENKVIFIDFGQVGRLNERMRYGFSSLVIGLMQRSTDAIIDALEEIVLFPITINFDDLRMDIDDLRDKYYDIPFKDLRLGEAINDLLVAAQKHDIKIPKDFTILAKALVLIEGTAEKLNPELSILELAEPFGRELLRERLHPKNRMKTVWDESVAYSELLRSLPKQMKALLTEIQRGKLKVNMHISDTEKILMKLDQISNRISFSVTLLAFSIVMVALIIGSTFGNTSSFLTKLPAVEISFVVSFIMFLGLLWSIYRSGKF